MAMCSTLLKLLSHTRQILDCSKLKEFADDNYKFDENARKFSKWVKKTVRKGEIAGSVKEMVYNSIYNRL